MSDTATSLCGLRSKPVPHCSLRCSVFSVQHATSRLASAFCSVVPRLVYCPFTSCHAIPRLVYCPSTSCYAIPRPASASCYVIPRLAVLSFCCPDVPFYARLLCHLLFSSTIPRPGCSAMSCDAAATSGHLTVSVSSHTVIFLLPFVLHRWYMVCCLCARRMTVHLTSPFVACGVSLPPGVPGPCADRIPHFTRSAMSVCSHLVSTALLVVPFLALAAYPLAFLCSLVPPTDYASS